LILGAQVLFGFQFNAAFQEMFDALAALTRALMCAGLLLLVITIGLLITPSMQHRIVERGQDNNRVLVLATAYAGWALLPLATALAIDLFLAVGRVGGGRAGVIAALVFFAFAISCWYLLEFWLRARRKVMAKTQPATTTPLAAGRSAFD
jgi:hypothetical protein